MSGRHTITMNYPASWWRNLWREGAPSGNGKIGASVYGSVQDETILMNHEDLWHLGVKDELPDVAHTLEETRALMTSKAYKQASWHLTNALKAEGYATKLASVLPLGDLKVTMPSGTPFSTYHRQVHMDTGEVEVAWNEGDVRYSRSLFVSRAHDTIVYRIASSADTLSASISFAFHDTDMPQMAALCEKMKASVCKKVDEDTILYAVPHEDGSDYGAVVRVIPTGGKLRTDDTILRVESASEVLVLVKVFVGEAKEVAWSRLVGELRREERSYDDLLDEHLPLHQRLYHSASLRLGEDRAEETSHSTEELLLKAYQGEAPLELIEKMWSFGRYLFISGTYTAGQPFGMYGLWGGDYRLMWCHSMANENIQMMYWHTTVGGLVELLPSMFGRYEDLLEDFRGNARKLYGCRGIYTPAGTTPGIGVPNQIVPVIMNWTGAAGWLAQHFYEYALFTGDEVFLKERALPFMREAALFYEDFLLEKDGELIVMPSVSPENTPSNYMPTGGESLAHPMPTTVNATMDVAIIKELLSHLIEAYERTGEEGDDSTRWRQMLARLPAYTTNKDGPLKEWLHNDFEDRYAHRHLSHLYPLFPGKECTKKETPDLFDAIQTAVEKRELGAQTGWSLVHMASVYARLFDGEKALQSLDLLLRSCVLGNLFTLHNDWRRMGVSMDISTAPVQMDANAGFVNAVQEMLLYVSQTLVHILPALPEKWAQGEVKDFRYSEGRVSFSWNRLRKTFAADIVADRETHVTLQLPEWVSDVQLEGSSTALTILDEAGTYSLQLKVGESLRIQAK
ncbi:glycosyl hydrolase family 95 catalytic domain-containing protein [Aureibacillus halotolerans]|uniref:Alpha-L-fucosidase 2 n=1 Tax=Aureibacillus halotolerans TaxID=1508390 RepID=A0A4R6TWS3_9BACI|nr:glycoside hydrolase N-terminal domain-containing protein [Aureibacillus halotolerans]TDQ38320.1 alpha-L-fucosidase 2 [Aureibacillus halotolerans]